jgi:hypothetical protein
MHVYGFSGTCRIYGRFHLLEVLSLQVICLCDEMSWPKDVAEGFKIQPKKGVVS